MAKLITIKDIAREVGCSIATVSYVLNGREEKISEPTKRKIIQYANLYHYHGNSAARNLASGRSDAIALYFPDPVCLLSEANEAIALKRLAKGFSERKCHVFLIDREDLTPLLNVDAILAFGLDIVSFRAIGKNNLAPLVAIDSLINDPLFNEVVDDFDGIKQGSVLISLPLSSESYRNFLKERFSLTEVSSFEEAISASDALDGRSFYVRDPALYRLYVNSYKPCRLLDSLSKEKIEEIMELFETVRGETPPTARRISVKVSGS